MLVLVVLLTTCIVEFSLFRSSVFNVSALQIADDIGVYWDENCSVSAHSIDWGVLRLGGVKEVVLYVRNEGNESFLLFLTPTNWNPKNASLYLSFSWHCDYPNIGVGEVVKVTHSLHVSPYTRGISSFSFDIVLEGNYISVHTADINGDGRVNLKDVFLVGLAYGSRPGDPYWDSRRDVNKDGLIDLKDYSLVVMHYGEEY